MALSKRLRFEVMRRDNHTCRYCGDHAPDVVLTVDHVVPVALGGSDEPGNLVTACKDCNAGKTSSSPDAVTVGAVADDALRWAAAMKAAAASTMARAAEEDAYADAFLAAWNSWTGADDAIPLDSNWRTSVGQWRRAGLPIEMATSAIDRAMTRKTVWHKDVFRYTAGICWKMITELQEAARLALKADEEPSCSYCEKPHSECPYWSELECPCCVEEPHDRGLCHANNAGFRQGMRVVEAYEPWRNMLQDVIDGTDLRSAPYRWVA